MANTTPKADLGGILDILLKAGLIEKLLPYLPEILKLLAIFGRPGGPTEPDKPTFPDLPVVQPPLPEVPPDPGSPPAKLANIDLKIQWAADTQGNLRQDTDAMQMGMTALNWNCDIRFDTDLRDQYNNNFVPDPPYPHPKHNWHVKWVSPEGTVAGTKSIAAPDEVVGDPIQCRFGTGVYDNTNGYCLKMTFGVPAGDGSLTLRPMPGRWTAFVWCDIDGIESNEIPLKVD